MGGRGQGVGRGRVEVRGRISNGRYDRVRAGSGAAGEWNNRWQVLDQTGDENDTSTFERAVEGAVGGEREIRSGGEDNVTIRNQDRQQRVVNAERMEGRMETDNDTGGEGNGRNGNESVIGAARKRNLQERSPGQHDDRRTNRPRLDEFDVGALCEEIDKRMRTGMTDLLNKAPDEFKETMRNGIEVLLDGLKGVLNGTSDCVAEERKSREADGMRIEERLEKVEEKIQDMKRTQDNVSDEQVHMNIRRSEREMEDKVRHANSCLKLLDIDFGKATEDRMWMVRSVIGWIRDDINNQDLGVYDRIMKKTRVQILGRGTTAGRGHGGKTIYTVPVLLECRDRTDAADLDMILKSAGYFSTFHWPSEMMDFVKEAREEVRKLGYQERSHFIRIRPEERGGAIQIRADVKEKNGVKWQVKAFWFCPPADRRMWEMLNDIFTPRVVGRRSV
jgi:hypothetical protein